MKEGCVIELQAEVSVLNERLAANAVLITKQDKEIVLIKAQLEVRTLFYMTNLIFPTPCA